MHENEKGFADIGYHVDMYGNSSNRISTPQLDKLAYSGIRLENYYIQPVCVSHFLFGETDAFALSCFGLATLYH